MPIRPKVSRHGRFAPPQIFRHQLGTPVDPEPLRLANVAPPWRQFKPKNYDGPFRTRPMDKAQERIGATYLVDEAEARLVNAALVLRRPLLISGRAGVGKSSLAYAVARQLGLGNVLRWPVTSRSTLKEALYEYDAIGRLQEEKQDLGIGNYITLGPLGAALLPNGDGPYQPRVLLIDEIDKSDIDLPNDLLHVLETGKYEIPEIGRSRPAEPVPVGGSRIDVEARIPTDGVVTCDDFPLVILTTNGERDFSSAFRRRCLEMTLKPPTAEKLKNILKSQLKMSGEFDKKTADLLKTFKRRMDDERFRLAVDQLLNAVFLVSSSVDVDPATHDDLLEAVFHSLTESPPLAGSDP